MVLVGLALPAPGEAIGWGWLGVRIRDISEQEMEEISSRHGIREGYGVLIVEVIGETPAARSGLKNGDLVVAFEGRPVVDTRTLQRLVSSTPVGEQVSLTVLRGQEGRRPIVVGVGAMPLQIRAERVAVEFGFGLRWMSQGEAGSAGGLPAVGFVLRGSRAEQSGLQPGDVVLEINSRRLDSSQAVNQALVEASMDQPLFLMVRRGSESRSLTLRGLAGP
jgi:S1-C subfamily serine protease